MNLQNLFSGLGSSAGKNIFISYRVQDTAGETGRLVDALKERFDEKHIFIDIEKIEPGLDFSQVISRSLDSCDVMLAIIGPNWLGLQPSGNSLRIQDPNDWVRLEISTALKRGIRVIPVLVDGAPVPSASQLPDDLAPLLMRQAYEVSNKRWKYDTDQLIEFLEKSVGIPAKNAKRSSKSQQQPWRPQNSFIVGAISAFMVFVWLLVAAMLYLPDYIDQTYYDANYNPDETNTLNTTQSNTVPANTHTNGDGEQKAVEEHALQVYGKWGDDAGNVLIINKFNNYFKVRGYDINGSEIGSGRGYTRNQHVEFDFRIIGGALKLKFELTLSADGRLMKGDIVDENNYTIGKYSLIKLE